jgi:hypothetical protein
MTKKFLTSVADVYGYDQSDNLVFTGKTLLDSSVEVTLGSAPVRGGKGNQLQYIYYHTAEMTFTLTDTQWNIGMLGETLGSDYELGNYYYEEEVAVSASGSGTVSGTPLAYNGASTIYGWATDTDDRVQRVSFTGSVFNVVGKSGEDLSGDYCIRYYKANVSDGKEITVKANVLPSIVKLVLESQLNSADTTTNKIGVVQIIAPKATLSGGFTLSMTSDGVSTTPLTATALAVDPATVVDECTKDPFYAKIVEIIDDSNWYDSIYDLSIDGGDFSLASGATKDLKVYAVPNSGNAFLAPDSGLTFSSSASIVTVGANTGIVTAVESGSSTISVYVTSASTVDTSAVVTVS